MSFDPIQAHDDRLETWLREAHLLRLRQEWAACEAKARQILEAYPEDPAAWEMLGDAVEDRGGLDEALAAFRRAHELRPDWGRLEEKIGRIVILQAEELRERDAAQLLLNSPRSQSQQRMNTNVALLLSVLCPGAGQMYNRQYVKGGILLAGFLAALFLGGDDFIKFILGVTGTLPRNETVNGGLALLGFVGLAVYLYGLMDAVSQAGKVIRVVDV